MNPVLWLGLPWTVLLLLGLPTAIVVHRRFDLPTRAERTLESRPYVTRLLGAADILLVVLVGSAARAHPAIGVVALVLLLLLGLLLLVGLSAVAISFARLLRADPDVPDSPAAFTLGWLLLAGLPLLPILGPLYFLWFAAAAVGAPLLSMRNRCQASISH
jgi:hypothetical protein